MATGQSTGKPVEYNLSDRVVQPYGADASPLRSHVSGWVNAKSHNAAGDGTSDDATSLNAAISDASNGPGIVLIPEGTFVIGAQINMAAGVTLRGAGPGKTILKVKSGAQIRAIVAQNVSDWAIEDLTIDTNKAGTTDAGSDTNQQAIYALATAAAGIKRARIQNVRATNGWRMGLYLATTDTATPGTWPLEVDVIGCRVEGYARNGIFASRGVGLRVLDTEVTGSGAEGVNINRSQKWQVSRCYVHDNGWHGIVANTDSRDFLITDNRCFDNDVAQSHGANNNGIGIVASINAQRFVIANNRSEHNGGQGISIDVKLPDVSASATKVVRASGTVTVTVSNTVAVGDTVYLKTSADAALFPAGEKTVTAASASSFSYAEAGADGTNTVTLTFVNTTQVPVAGTIVGNVASNNLGAHGIYAQFLTGLTITGNQAFGNAISGIYVTAAKEVSIVGNVASGNAATGISCSEPTVAAQGYVKVTSHITVQGNTMYGNTEEDFSMDALITGGPVFYEDVGAAPPASGIWVVGMRRRNSAPAVGQPKAWVCTVAGTPGTWVSEGNL